MSSSNPILKTKFFLPRPTSDFVERKELLSRFEALREIPFMLVSATTGYGKSTVVASYLRNRNETHTWLSLSEKENDFKQFVAYFITAIQQQIEGFGQEVLDLSETGQSATPEVLSDYTLNELAKLDDEFYFALDDYHLISNEEIHQFITKLFQYPQPYFKLILITRRDPAIPLAVWRNKNMMVEIRASDLKFDKNEIREFCKKAAAIDPDHFLLSKVEEVTEGWISGLRMMLLSSSNDKELQRNLEKFNDSRIFYQLIQHLLKNESEQNRERLLKLSMLKEFNMELFAALCLTEEEQQNKESEFSAFIAKLTKSNLFLIELDDKHDWFRFHHFFTDQLFDIFQKEYDEENVRELRVKAADWFQENGFAENAIEFYLEAGELNSALEVFKDYKSELISGSRFMSLEQIFNAFPKDYRENNGILKLTETWIYFFKSDIKQMAKSFNQVELLLKKEKLSQYDLDLSLGEVCALKAYDLYLNQIDPESCLTNAEMAIELLKDKKNPYAFGLAWIFYGASMQLLNKAEIAKQRLQTELEVCDEPGLKTQLYLILFYIDWYEANMELAQKSAKRWEDYGHEANRKMTLAHAKSAYGVVLYHVNKLEEASQQLEEAMNLRHYGLQALCFPAISLLAKSYFNMGLRDKTKMTLQILEGIAFKLGVEKFTKIYESINADINWQMSKQSEALKWAKENDFTNFLPLVDLFIPELVQARILAFDDQLDSLELSLKIVNQMISFFEERNNINFSIRGYLIKSVVNYKLNKEEEAFKMLKKGLTLSEGRKLIRVYLDLGETMKTMLEECRNSGFQVGQIDEILQHFSGSNSTNGKIILSRREKEILVLAKKMTNKEVGSQLFIAEKTVKVHITNINKKLKAKNKIEAFEKAKALNLI